MGLQRLLGPLLQIRITLLQIILGPNFLRKYLSKDLMLNVDDVEVIV